MLKRFGLALVLLAAIGPIAARAGFGHFPFGHCGTCYRPFAGCGCPRPICAGCRLPPLSCRCLQQPVLAAPACNPCPPVMQPVVRTEIRREAQVVDVPVTTCKQVTVDAGGYQMVWVPKLVTGVVPETTMQRQIQYRDVPYQSIQMVPGGVSSLGPTMSAPIISAPPMMAPMVMPPASSGPIMTAPAPVMSAPAPIISSPAPIMSSPAPILSGPTVSPPVVMPPATSAPVMQGPIMQGPVMGAPSYGTPMIHRPHFHQPQNNYLPSRPLMPPMGAPGGFTQYQNGQTAQAEPTPTPVPDPYLSSTYKPTPPVVAAQPSASSAWTKVPLRTAGEPSIQLQSYEMEAPATSSARSIPSAAAVWAAQGASGVR